MSNDHILDDLKREIDERTAKRDMAMRNCEHAQELANLVQKQLNEALDEIKQWRNMHGELLKIHSKNVKYIEELRGRCPRRTHAPEQPDAAGVGCCVDRYVCQHRQGEPAMIKAYYGKEVTVPGDGICFAASASKAKALIFRSAIDAGFKVRFQDIKVRRSPTYDGCMPDDYRHQFFTLEHAEIHLRPNVAIKRGTNGVNMYEEATKADAVGPPLELRVGPHRVDVAALYVEPKGCYVGVPGVDPWDEARDARTYTGPYPVVAHPPCQRWGRFWHGSTRKPHQYNLGDDGGCFAAALDSVNRWGGVIEHPADSKAWDEFGITKPPRNGGWVSARMLAGQPVTHWTCCVYQGHYGHASGKATWLYVSGIDCADLPALKWGKTEQRLPEWMIERYGYEKARRIGVVAMVGGKNKTAIRNATPPEFRDILLALARRCQVRPNVEITGPASGSGASSC